MRWAVICDPITNFFTEAIDAFQQNSVHVAFWQSSFFLNYSYLDKKKFQAVFDSLQTLLCK